MTYSAEQFFLSTRCWQRLLSSRGTAQLRWLALVVGRWSWLSAGNSAGAVNQTTLFSTWSLHVAWAAGFQKEVFQRCESGSCKSPEAQPHDHFCWNLLVKASHTSIQIRNRLFMGKEAKSVQPSLNAPSLTCITSWITYMEQDWELRDQLIPSFTYLFIWESLTLK